ncbi:PREDICTED: RCC1 and BTB domain-containing protein 1-like, partial [Trachymyrmex cornetzi]|uniref:RCC1 and BTB domain-containing protein 1-like n=1 Tax=Trachymyrmex cornetzi TaxID=471704 RepID=UPI00084F6CDC
LAVQIIACGANYCVIITNNSEVYEWSYCNTNDDYQAKKFFVTKPRKMIQFSTQTVVKVVCGYWDTFVLTDKGKVYTWKRQIDPCHDIGELISTDEIKVPKMIKASDIATIDGASAIKCSEDQLVYIRGELFRKKIKELAICEYTNIFDICNLTVAQSPISITYEDTDEESMILSDLDAAFNDSSTSDLTIEVEKKSIYVHKSILKIRSSYFANIFHFSGLENKQRVIKYDDYSYIVYTAFLKYLYTGVIDLSCFENELKLLVLSDKCCMKSLERDCIRRIKKKMTVSNVSSIIETAVKCNNEELKEYCSKFMEKEGIL